MKSTVQQSRKAETTAGSSRSDNASRRKLRLVSFCEAPHMDRNGVHFSLASDRAVKCSALGNLLSYFSRDIDSEFKNARVPNLDEVIAANIEEKDLETFDLSAANGICFHGRLYVNISALQKALDLLPKAVVGMEISFEKTFFHVLEPGHLCPEVGHDHTLTYDPYPEFSVYKTICSHAMRNNWKNLCKLYLDNADMGAKTWSALGQCLQSACPTVEDLIYTRDADCDMQQGAEETPQKRLYGPWFNARSIDTIHIRARISPCEAFIFLRTSIARKACGVRCEGFLWSKKMEVIKQYRNNILNCTEIFKHDNQCMEHKTKVTRGCQLVKTPVLDLPLKLQSHQSRTLRILMSDILGCDSAASLNLWVYRPTWISEDNKKAKAFVEKLKIPQTVGALDIFPLQL